MNPNVQIRIMGLRGMGRFIVLVVVVGSLASAASAEWKEKVLYSFQGVPDGAVPAGGVVFDKAGNLYGATEDGRSSSCDSPGQCGTVYQLAPPTQKGGAWTETVLYVFKGHAYNDGATPEGGVLIDQAGNLYGTTGYGGSGPCTLLGGAVGCGTVYELSPPAKQGDPWTETVLYNFQGGKDGDLPTGPLVFDSAGNLYGATEFGGGKGTTCDEFYGGNCGTVFKLSPPKSKGGQWTEKVLHSFAGIGTGKQYGDGAEPNGGLALDSAGAIYGTTFYGGYNCPHNSNQGCGTVFALKPPTKRGEPWTEELMHVFRAGNDGGGPNGGLIFDKAGSVYGTAGGGPSGDAGIVFRLMKNKAGAWQKAVLYGFDWKNGADPLAGLIFDSSGSLYGTTYVGNGKELQGSVFRLKPPHEKGKPWIIGYLHGFVKPPDGMFPAAKLVFDRAGNLYSTTQEGGSATGCGDGGCGTVFEVHP
jgi:hypothetical protein